MTEKAAPLGAPGQGDVLLRTIGLGKRFDKLEVVKDLNLELRRGEVLGFLGPNGAGKSTTVGMILGLIAPTSGSVELFGVKQGRERWVALNNLPMGFGGGSENLPGVTHAVIVLAVYSLGFLVLSYYLFGKRDVTG